MCRSAEVKALLPMRGVCSVCIPGSLPASQRRRRRSKGAQPGQGSDQKGVPEELRSFGREVRAMGIQQSQSKTQTGTETQKLGNYNLLS